MLRQPLLMYSFCATSSFSFGITGSMMMETGKTTATQFSANTVFTRSGKIENISFLNHTVFGDSFL